MTPVEQHVVAEIEVVAPANTGITARVAREQIVVERAVSAAPRSTEGVIVQIERFAGNVPLDGQVFSRHFLVRSARFNCLAQPACAAIVAVSDLDDFTAAPARGKSASSLGAGKGWNLLCLLRSALAEAACQDVKDRHEYID